MKNSDETYLQVIMDETSLEIKHKKFKTNFLTHVAKNPGFQRPIDLRWF
jgi:hypothetical protein